MIGETSEVQQKVYLHTYAETKYSCIKLEVKWSLQSDVSLSIVKKYPFHWIMDRPKIK